MSYRMKDALAAFALLLITFLAHDVCSAAVRRASSTTAASLESHANLASKIEHFQSQSHQIAKTIISHSLPLQTIINNLANLEEKILTQEHQLKSQAAAQKKSCARVTITVQKMLDNLIDEESKAKKKAELLDENLRKKSQAEEEKSMLLVQLQEQIHFSSSTEVAVALNENSKNEKKEKKEKVGSSKPIKVITSSFKQTLLFRSKIQYIITVLVVLQYFELVYLYCCSTIKSIFVIFR